MCLICGGAIEDGRATLSDGVAFVCAKHGGYLVARTALPRFQRSTPELQEAALLKAQVFAAQRNNEVIVTSIDL